ncbi:MAG: hypothetical protein JRM77_09470 [Nitrososphaerota archaeon]|nr:hypothetical protein [Nitrososphaerota archaeon]
MKRVLFVAALLVLSVLVVGFSLNVKAESVGNWTSTTAYGGGIVDYQVCAVSSGYVYCVGGAVGGSVSSAVYYAPVSSTGVGPWTSTTAYGGGTVYGQSCAISSSYIYCLGGYVAGSVSSAAYYAPVSPSGIGTWTATTNYAPGTVYGQSCAISSSYIYCVGGQVNGSPSSAVYYAPISATGIGAWTSTTAYAPGTVYFQSCVVSSGYIYCVGGYVAGSASSAVYYAPFFAGIPSATIGNVQADTGGTAVVNCQSAMDVGFAKSIPAAEIESAATQVNFTTAALGGTTNPSQTFGVGCDSSNPPPQSANVTTISGSAITLTLSDIASHVSYTVFYHLKGTTIYSVTVNSGTSTNTIPDTSYVANQGTLSTCAAPCAYDSGSYTEVKAVYVAPTTLTFSLTAAPSSNGGGGGSSQPPSTPPPTCPTGDVYNTTSGACQTGSPVKYSAPVFGNETQIVIGFAVVGGLIFLVAARIAFGDKSKTETKKGSQPKIKKEKGRQPRVKKEKYPW